MWLHSEAKAARQEERGILEMYLPENIVWIIDVSCSWNIDYNN